MLTFKRKTGETVYLTRGGSAVTDMGEGEARIQGRALGVLAVVGEALTIAQQIEAEEVTSVAKSQEAT